MIEIQGLPARHGSNSSRFVFSGTDLLSAGASNVLQLSICILHPASQGHMRT